MAWAQTRRTLFVSALAALFVANAAAAPAGGDAAFTMAAERAVAAVEREDGFSGVILVARGDKVLLRKAAGFSNRERNILNTPETKFPIESVTKQFTATAIMLLLEDGKVSLTDPISKYYPASPSAWKDVTIKHLLTHSSGIEDYWVHRHETYDESAFRTLQKTSADWFRLVLNDSLAFEPGKGFSYSNAGYALLAEVIERASGQSYGDFLRRRVFAPLGMRDSASGTPPGNTVNGYVRSSTGIWQKGQMLDENTVSGAGGIYSTLDDMLIWSRAWNEGKVLSASSREAMLTDYGYNYGFGWRFSPKFGRKLIWHTGNDQNGGLAAIFDRFPEEQLTVIVMTNNTGLTDSTATLMIEGKETTFQANAARKLVEQVERLYFGRAP